MPTTTQFMVGMSDIHTAKGTALFTCLGLGSCIGFCAFDPKTEVGGMAHIMLPEAFPDKPVDKPGKFANTAIPELISILMKMGADPTRLLIAYAGGAQVFRFGADVSSRLDVGARNAEAVESLSKKFGLRVVAKDVGGSSGRTVTMCLESGEIKVKTVSGGEKPLCNLRSR